MVEYYSNWKGKDFDCHKCGWSGKGADCTQGEFFWELVEMDCPACHNYVFQLDFPRLEDYRSNWANLSETDKKQYFLVEKHRQDVEDTSLKSSDQLPDLDTDDLILTWDIDDWNGGDNLIKFGDRILWKEKASFENYERFVEVAKLLKEKYGKKLQDLVPTRKSALYLYGDFIPSRGIVERCRESLTE